MNEEGDEQPENTEGGLVQGWKSELAGVGIPYKQNFHFAVPSMGLKKFPDFNLMFS